MSAAAQLSLPSDPPAPVVTAARTDFCWWCGQPLGRAAAVTDAAQPGLAFWHRRCWKTWVSEQRFKRGRAPKSLRVDLR